MTSFQDKECVNDDLIVCIIVCIVHSCYFISTINLETFVRLFHWNDSTMFALKTYMVFVKLISVATTDYEILYNEIFSTFIC